VFSKGIRDSTFVLVKKNVNVMLKGWVIRFNLFLLVPRAIPHC